jgi:hypothetical protein
MGLLVRKVFASDCQSTERLGRKEPNMLIMGCDYHPKQVIMIAVAIGEMVGSDQVPDRQITSEPFGLVMANVFQLERNGVFSRVHSEVRLKNT